MASSISFEDLPTDVLKHTASFLVNAPDLLRCERTCKRLQLVVSDDELWRNRNQMKGLDPRIKTNREHLCIMHNLRNVRRHQYGMRHQEEPRTNILIVVFPTEAGALTRWRDIVSRVMQQTLPRHLRVHKLYNLRWDTMLTMLDILEAFLTSSFERAMKVLLSFPPKSTYPRISNRHMVLQNELGQQKETVFKYFKVGGSAFANSLLDQETRNKIVRRFAFRSGITRLDNDVFDSAWGALISLIEHLWYPICEKHVGGMTSLETTTSMMSSTTMRRQIDCRMAMRHIPPYPIVYSLPCLLCGLRTVCYTPVPLELEEIACGLLPTAPLRILPDYLDRYNDDADVEVLWMKATYEILEDREVDSSQEDFSDEDDDSCSAISNESPPHCPFW